ncbi:hypothetical protein O181_025423 [Austropuccinia psidii MF-1]|uniref:CCAAT-binding factor domain-containing protein n=1 Tax=Austropuccinia psidii MF-1 TaxID=1389203 RepID=A0A9Q3GZ36_9BASI|nr:hypothetical protein [Austropuccinia psidii MF-1]
MAEEAVDYGKLILSKLNQQGDSSKPHSRKKANKSNQKPKEVSNDNIHQTKSSGSASTSKLASQAVSKSNDALRKAKKLDRKHKPEPSSSNSHLKVDSSNHNPKPSNSNSKQKENENRKQKNAESDANETDILLQEIKKLGGDEADLELVAGPDDQEELQGDQIEDPRLESDLKKFMKGLDFSPFTSFAFPSSTVDSEALPLISKEEQTEAALSNLAALEAKLDDPVEKAKLNKREAKIIQRRSEAEKHQEKLAQEKEQAEAHKRQQARIETEAKVKDVKTRLVPDQSGEHTPTWLLQAQPIWYDVSYLPPLPLLDKPPSQPSAASITILRNRADFILSTITHQFTQSLQPAKQSGMRKKPIGGLSESDKVFIHKILTSGTSSDRLSALMLLVSSAPLQSKAHLSTLLNLCKKKSREEAGRTIRAVVEWLRGAGNPQAGGLPPHKLKYFNDQPNLAVIAEVHILTKGKSQLMPNDERRMEHDEWLALWAFEDWFKKWYLEFLRGIEAAAHDPLAFTRTQSISHLFYLLNDKPEQEQNLLTLLVNKLGDNDKNICSRSSHYLLQLLEMHPLMKSIIVREVSALLLKPIVHSKKVDLKNSDKKVKDQNIRHHDHARYYGAITLNQMPLTKADNELSTKLIEVYFELFNDILGKTIAEEAEIAEQGMKEKNEEELEVEHVEKTQTVQKASKFDKKGSKASLAGRSEKEMIEEEALAEQKSKLIAAILTGLNRAFPYGTLGDETFNVHMNTLFRISHTGTFNVSIQALILIQHLTSSKPDLADRFYRALYSTIIDQRLFAATSKHALYLNLLFKSLKADKSQPRVLAFVKRIVQILPYHQPSFICSTIVLLGDFFSTTGAFCRSLLNPIMISKSTQNSDSELHGQYDGRKRDPLFANAENSFLWELVPLLSHFHPAVSLNASQLISGDPISSSVDLNLHTLSHFLDKFVYRQPKKNVAPKGSAIMQPQFHGRLGNVVKHPHRKSGAEAERAPINDKAFLQRSEKEIPVDEVFFYKFFTAKASLQERQYSKKKKVQTEAQDFGGRGGSDDGSDEAEADEEQALDGYDDASDAEINEDEVWAAMRGSMSKELKEALPDDESWSDMDPAAFDESEDDGMVQELLNDEDLSFNDSEVDANDAGNSLGDLQDEEISVSGLEDEESERNFKSDEEDGKAGGRKRRLDRSAQKELKKKKRKMLRNLPAFASAEDYATLLSGDE